MGVNQTASQDGRMKIDQFYGHEDVLVSQIISGFKIVWRASTLSIHNETVTAKLIGVLAIWPLDEGGLQSGPRADFVPVLPKSVFDQLLHAGYSLANIHKNSYAWGMMSSRYSKERDSD